MYKYIRAYMEGLDEGLKILIQEMIPNGENIVEETHNKKKLTLIAIS